MSRVLIRSLVVGISSLLVIQFSPAAELTRINERGEVVEVGFNTITFRTGSDELLIASLDPRRVEGNVIYDGIPEPNVKVIGTLAKESLAPGMYVRFEARLKGRRRIAGPVEQLTVISPGPDATFGLLPRDAVGNEAAGRVDLKPDQDVYVIGRVAAVRRGSLNISFPRGGSLQVDLAPAATITLDATDHRLARPGDTIQVEGLGSRPPRFFATNVTITRTQPGSRTPGSTRRDSAGVGTRERRNLFDLGDPEDKAAGDAASPKRGKILRIN